MADSEFDVDASIAAGWDRFAARLADLLRTLQPGTTFDLTVPVLGTSPGHTPYFRFTSTGTGQIEATVSGGGTEDSPTPLRPAQLEQLGGLGWAAPASPGAGGFLPGPRVVMPDDRTSDLAHLISGTMEQVFAIPHPVFLHDVVDCEDPESTSSTSDGPVPDDADFRPQPITDPDQATLALEATLSELYRRRVRADQHGVVTLPAGHVLLFVRAHRSLPLIVLRSPLVSRVEDASAAETEVAILNRDSLWCRYVVDGETITADAAVG